MILEYTNKVTKENGPRPAGKSDECFYCHNKLGEDHKKDCVCRRKTVVMEYTFKLVIEMPQSFTPYDIEFNRNDGSWCASNAIEELKEMTKDGCLCNVFKAKYLGEAK